MGVLVEEQETTITFSRADGYAKIWTSDSTVMTKLDRLCDKSDNYILLETGKLKSNGEVVSKLYRVEDKSLISFRGKKMDRSQKPMTYEQKLIMADRLAKARQVRVEKNALQD